MTRFAFATLHVGDLDKSLAFYRDIIGMKVVDKYRIEEVNETVAVVQQEGGGSIELVGKPGFVLDVTAQENFSLAFEVDDAMAIIERMGSECTDSVEPSPNTKFFFCKDPDGYSLNLIQRS